MVKGIPDLKEMEITQFYTLYSYVADIVLLIEPRYDVEEIARKLIKSNNLMGLVVIDNKTK